MSATYDPTCPTNRDHVRLLVGDTVVIPAGTALLQDEEIDALIAAETVSGEGLKFVAAARALSVLQIRWASTGKGVTAKNVGRLGIKYGVDMTAGIALSTRINELRERGVHLGTPTARIFKVL